MPLDDRIVTDLREAFNEHADGGKVLKDKIGDVFKSAGEPIAPFKLRELFKDSRSESFNFEEFLDLFEKMDLSTNWGAKLRQNVQSKGGLIQISGTEQSAEGTVHSVSDAECWSFSNFINRLLKDDGDLKRLLPINAENHELFEKVKDGVLLCKLINLAVPNTIDERAINKTKLNKFTINENLDLAINSASSIGCHVVNIGPHEIYEGRPHMILGLVWQVIRIKLLAAISLKNNPNLICLLKEGETMEMLLALSPEELLMRWVNYQLDKTQCPKRMANFSSDVKDSVIYSYLMDEVVPKNLMKHNSSVVLSESKDLKRAELVINNAESADCAGLVTAYDISTGNQKLNMAFVANLFNTYPNLEAAEEPLVIEETREEKTYRNWMNSLGVKPQINWLYPDLSNGLALLQLHDIINPGSVNWEKVNKGPFKGPSSNIKMIENCNKVVELGKNAKLSLVGIAGDDIYNCNKTLVLGMVWQMMHLYTLGILQKLSGSSKPVSDAEIVQWVNNKLEGTSYKISSFKDASLATSHAILELIDVMQPGSVNKDYIKPGTNDEEKLLNAQYAISMARRIGARVYALPEDIVEGKFKMVMTIFACLMAKDLSK